MANLKSKNSAEGDRRARHPKASDLQAFLLGKLGERSSAQIEQHLESCEACSNRLDELSESDDFVDLIRNAETISGKSERGRSTKWDGEDLQAAQESFFLGKYKLLEMLGKGGMGAVFKAQQTGFDRFVAIKVMAPELLNDAELVKRFLREMQAVAALSHPNIVAAFDADCARGNTYYLVMEYVNGIDLETWCKKAAPLPIDWTCECIRQAALGLQHAHNKDLVHRDIKPSNLLVVGKDTTTAPLVKILDMGIAQFTKEETQKTRITATGQIIGTLDYIAPEQALDAKAADCRSDIFSLGCTLFEALTGEPAITGNNATEKLFALATKDIRRLSELRPEIPPELDAVVNKMVQREPEDRYQTALEVAEALEPFCLGYVPDSKSVSKDTSENEMHQFLGYLASKDEPQAQAGTAVEEADDGEQLEVLPELQWPAHWWWVGGGAALLLLFAVLAGVILRFNTPQGTILVEVNQPDAEITVDGGWISVKSPLVREAVKIRVAEGKHLLEVRKEGFREFTREFTLKKGETPRLSVKLIPNNGEAAPPLPPTKQVRQSPTDKQLAQEQIAVVKWLMEEKGLGVVLIDGVGTVNKPPTSPFRMRRLTLHCPLTTEELPRLAVLVDLEYLDLGSQPLTDEALTRLAPLSELNTLNVNHTKLTPASVRTLRQFPKLENLTMTFASAEWVEALRQLPALRSLHFYRNHIPDESMQRFKDFPKLISLFIEQGKVSEEGLFHLQQARQLRLLKIKSQAYSQQTFEKLARAMPWCEIHHIEGDPAVYNPGKAGLEQVAVAQWLLKKKRLKGLEIEKDGRRLRTTTVPSWPCKVRDVNLYPAYSSGFTAEELQRLHVLVDLEKLNLAGQNSLTDEAFSHLAPLVNLQVLGLNSTRVTAASVQTLRRFPKLEYLHVSTLLGSEEAIKALAELPNLQTLALTGKVSDESLKWIKDFPKLVQLHLRKTVGISESGLLQLQQAKQLRLLQLDSAGVEQTTVEKLAQAMPWCEIHDQRDPKNPVIYNQQQQ